jgi:tetratricopeptide (TPR) repeat protein
MMRSFVLTLRTWIDRLSGQRRRVRDLLWGFPALLLFVAFMAATAMGHVQQVGSGQKYWIAGERQLAAGNPEVAQIFLQKALLSDKVNRHDVMFSLAQSYEAAEQFDRADALMGNLAAVGTAGYPAAHRYLAIRTSQLAAETKTVPNMQEWQWHLSHADQVQSTDLQKAWGLYFLVGNDLENAAIHFRKAAEQEPQLWLQVAELEARMNDMEAVRRTLATARQRLEQQFRREPNNADNRLLYATSLFYIGELPDAERLLKEGLQDEDNESFRQLLAAVFVRMYDAELDRNDEVDSGFRFLQMALEYDPNYYPALKRLVTFARSSPEGLESSREAMRRLIASGNTSALAHFTLGSLEWIAGNNQLAILNMKQAIELDERMPVVANNLAFLLSQEEGADLQVALNLINQALESAPDNPDFRDTRGSIYEQMGETAKAAVDYQKALETSSAPPPCRLNSPSFTPKWVTVRWPNNFFKCLKVPSRRPGNNR